MFGDHMELLLLTKSTTKNHVLIEDFNKLMFKQTKHKKKKHFCMSCLQCFSSKRILNNHREVCSEINGHQTIRIPQKGSKIKFENYHKQLKVPSHKKSMSVNQATESHIQKYTKTTRTIHMVIKLFVAMMTNTVNH